MKFTNPTNALTVNAGDGNDTVMLQPLDRKTPINFPVTIDGGAGNDIIDASTVAFNVTFLGGAGNDVLKGGSGDDISTAVRETTSSTARTATTCTWAVSAMT